MSYTELTLPKFTDEEAVSRIIAWLRLPTDRRLSPGATTPNPHDLYLPDLIGVVLEEVATRDRNTGPRQYEYNYKVGSAPFYQAAALLCTRGILAPVPTYPPTPHNSLRQTIGAAFSVTDYGHKWLSKAGGFDCLPTDFTRFSQLLGSHSQRFGNGYHARSQEAALCYQAHTYLACCTMCGAAAESILLALASAKKSEEEIMGLYLSSGGRRKVENLLVGQQTPQIKQLFGNYMSLLSYWRDEAAHGTISPISEEEAFTSLLLLLRFAQFGTDRWAELTQAVTSAAVQNQS